MKTIKYIAILIIGIVLLNSCNTSEDISLQKYYVESESNKNYLMLDIPTNIVSISDTASEKAKQAYESIDKINLIAFKLNATNNDDYLVEKRKVTKILKNKVFKELMRVNDKGNKLIVKFLGDDESMDEVIAFVSSKEKGFALARVLGNDMKPENMLELLESIKDMDKDSDVFGKLSGFFSDMDLK